MKERIDEILDRRLKEFSTSFNKYEYKELNTAIEIIDRLVPPSYFDGLTTKGDAKILAMEVYEWAMNNAHNFSELREFMNEQSKELL